uniref:Phosphatase tensin-type domain-containing protein n=1 Tax=Rhabditophanes sp. KR3021 TaxID=114890 RepID=A0AC35U6U8_9BILA
MLSRNSSPSKTHTPTIKELFFSTLQIAVSQNRRRFINNGFNLDLTYITDRIIAMGYPSTGAEEFYRNSMKSTREFLEMFHKGHYFVFNLRGNYLYDRANFDNRVAVYKMTDHHPPNLEMMAPFCKQVDEYMRKDPSNVIAVHCKAGKGRTGVMICAYLVHIDFFPNPRTCIDYYSCIRTKNNKGVTIPSQRRYVYYFDYLKKNKLPYEQLKIELVGIYIEKPPKLDSTSLVKKHFSLRIANKGKRVFEGLRFEWSNADFATEESQWNGSENRNGNDQYDQYNPIEGNDCISRRCFGWTLEPGERVHLEGDVRLDILCTSTLPFTRSQTKLCHLWFNTMFACPSFSKGYFMYGDEMFPYTDNLSELVKKVPVSKGESIRINKQNRPASGKENISVSPKKSPCTSKKLKMGKLFKGAKTEFIEDNSADPPTTSESGSKEESSPSKGKPNDSTELKDINKSDLKKGSLTGKKDLINISPTNLNQSGPFIPGSATINKSIDFSVINREDSNVSSPCAESQLIKTLSLSEENLFPLNSAERYCACNLNIPEANRSEWVAAVPPGLEAHCPKETLSLIYKTNDENMAKPPRYQAAKFIKKAFDDDLINDDYNLSKNKEEKKRNTSNIVSKASLTHKKFGGPMCLMRKDGEHVQIYDAIQIDRAFKETHISKSFKVIVVTRCIRDNVSEGNHPSSSRCGGENYQSKENHPQQCKLHENRIPAYPTNQ